MEKSAFQSEAAQRWIDEVLPFSLEKYRRFLAQVLSKSSESDTDQSR